MHPLDTSAIMELMFPVTQTPPAPTGDVGAAAAPSIADIAHEETQGGRLIVRFLVSTMLGDFEDARTCHRLDASGRLITLEADKENPFSDIIREETHNGKLIVRFLSSVILDEIENAGPHHRYRASDQLTRLDPKAARALAQTGVVACPVPRQARIRARKPAPAAPEVGAHPHPGVDIPTGDGSASIADIARQETDNGRDAIRFLVDVMYGSRPEFDTQQRMDAAIEIIERCSDRSPCVHGPTPDPCYDTDADTAAVGADPVPETTWKDEWDHFEYPEDRTYDFSSYDKDDYRRDVYGAKALSHIFGDDETKSVANYAVLDYKVDQIEAQRAAVHSEYETCQPYDPCPSCRVPDPPDDDSFGSHTYGYNALLFIYGDKASARVGYTTAMAHKKKLAYLAAAADDPDHDPANGPDPPDPYSPSPGYSHTSNPLVRKCPNVPACPRGHVG